MSNNTPHIWHRLLGLCAAAVLSLASNTVEACGGFFCSQAAPVNQSAEQIIFSQNADDTVTAIISIQYQGPSSKFAWVLPIAGVPEVGVSSSLAFSRLLSATTPQYSLTTRVEGTCAAPNYNNFNGGFATGGTTAVASGGTANGGSFSGPTVTVVSQGSVGPYDFVAISVSQDATNPAQVAIDWLGSNSFDVSALGEDILGSYLEQGLNLLAFRLSKSSNSGSIRPIRVTYPAKFPAIPIRPTAVAATDNMGVMVYMVSDAQAIPKNYKSLLLNEALINWFFFSATYNDVINRAADEAGGQGFVTEFGGPSSRFSQTVWSQSEQQSWNAFQNQDYSLIVPVTPLPDGGAPATQPWLGLYNYAAANYGSYDGFREAMQTAFTLPSDVPLDALFANPYLYETDDRIQLDQLKLLAGLQENVIDPLVETQKLLISRPYLTRLFTTMSADEMTVDPLFSANPDLADISNVHSAEQVIECSPDVQQFEAPWRVELPQGGTVHGQAGQNWPIAADDKAMPANRKVVELSETGSGKVVKDNSTLIWQALGAVSVVPNTTAMGSGNSGTVPIGGIDPMVPVGSNSSTGSLTGNRTTNGSGDSGGCSFGKEAMPRSGFTLLALLGLLAAHRRRSRGQHC